MMVDKVILYKNLKYQKFIKSGVLLRRIERLLDKNRFLHSLGVCHTMLLLAGRFDVDSGRAFIAGLLHDCGRCVPESRMKERLSESHFGMPDEDADFPKIWHARLGALMLAEDFAIDDPKIQRAVYVHPTGAPVMSKLAKLLFIADYIEPCRSFNGVASLRNMAFIDLERSFCLILKNKMNHVLKQGFLLHPDSRRAFDYYF
jgi:predicted HD superfamily hydrolase involved in NAD metabolism